MCSYIDKFNKHSSFRCKFAPIASIDRLKISLEFKSHYNSTQDVTAPKIATTTPGLIFFNLEDCFQDKKYYDRNLRKGKIPDVEDAYP